MQVHVILKDLVELCTINEAKAFLLTKRLDSAVVSSLGHGSCGTSDVCGCYKGFFGGDCSYRYCPVGPSWTVTPIEKLLDDRYSEMIVLNTPGGFVGHNKFDKESTKQYP